MSNDQKLAGARHSNSDKTLLRYGMIRVAIRQRQWIAKYGRGFLERNPVLPAILPGFGRVPFKIHHAILPRRRPREKGRKQIPDDSVGSFPERLSVARGKTTGGEAAEN